MTYYNTIKSNQISIGAQLRGGAGPDVGVLLRGGGVDHIS